MTKGNKRLKRESFTKYRKRIKDESKKIKSYLRGRYIWLSTDIRNSNNVILHTGLGTYTRSCGRIGSRKN